MEIKIFTKNFELTDAIRLHAEEKLKAIQKVDDKAMTVKLTLEKTNEKEHSFKVTGLVHGKNGDLNVHKTGEDAYALITLLAESLERLSRKQKEKKTDKTKNGKFSNNVE